MTLTQKIINIYPELADYDWPRGEITIQDDRDGKGPYIRKWNHPTLVIPTQEQLDYIDQ